MIRFMSLRLAPIAVVLALAAGCGGGASEADEPQTAREKQYAEAKKNGELDDTGPSKKGGWRFKGDRKDCRYLVGSKCFKSQANACKAAGCGHCAFTGAGPATVSCRK
jgi:hypothetical protein